MINNKLFYFGAAIALCGGLTSCAVDACSFDSDYKIKDPSLCDPKVPIDTGFTASPKRLSHISGGTMLITDKQNAGAEVILTKAGVTLSLGTLDENGVLKRDVAAAELKKFTFGEIGLELKNATTIRKSMSLRVYAEPSFPANEQNTNWAVIKVDTAQNPLEPIRPVMIGITPKPSILVMNNTKMSSGTVAQSTVEYSADINLGRQTDSSFLFNYPEKSTGDSYTGFSQSRMGVLFAGQYAASSSSIITMLFSVSGSTVSARTSIISLNKSVSLLCSDSSGKMTGAMLDQRLSFFQGQSLSDVVSVNDGNNPNAVFAASKYGIGDLDGDQQPDVAIWHSIADAVSVYTLKNGNLEWSPELSEKLKAHSASALGHRTPTAVRLADIDRDGVDDIILADRERLIILPNDGTGDYEKSIVINAIGSDPNALGPISAIAIGQLGNNQKSLPSLALVSSQAKKIAVVLNQSTE